MAPWETRPIITEGQQGTVAQQASMSTCSSIPLQASMKYLLCAQLWHIGRAPGQEDQSVHKGYD